MKKFIYALCVFSLLLSITSCSENKTNYSNQTLVGKVIAVDGTKITVQLGEFANPDAPPHGLPSNNSGDAQANGINVPPQQPSGESMAPPNAPSGAQSDGIGTPSDMPNKGAENLPSDMKEPPQANSSDGQMPMKGVPQQGMFKAGNETAVFDLSNSKITVESESGSTSAKLDDIAVGDIIELIVGENNEVTSIVLRFTE